MIQTVNCEQALRVLEFDRITELLADLAQTDGAKAMALRLLPDYDPERILRRLTQTSDAKTLITLKGTPSFGRVKEMDAVMERAEKSAVLSPRELLDAAAVLYTARRLIDYFNTDHRDEEQGKSLKELFGRLNTNRPLEEKIRRALPAEDMVADEASPALAEIRRKMRSTNAKIKESLAHYMSGAYSKVLQDNIVTMRGGRYVIPVKAEYKNEVKGLVHDTSASGATYFIEPMSVVDANNELRALESQEQHEIERILADLSADCAASSTVIVLDAHAIDELAFIFAKAELSFRMDGSQPVLSAKQEIDLHRARHPLIDKTKVVSTNISLGRHFDTIVITGPNTGGKTVTLKTLGLFALMTQAGLHIPAESDSVMCVFDAILADIGDEQSIEQNLSTFSAHMVRIVSILEAADEKSLVLFDELGAGTDPTEGAALAISVIQRVRKLGSLCAATTHYAELKAFALETDRVVNASCEFDVETLKPTYRLIIGTPGKSNAFAISLKLGLDPQIVENAKGLVSADSRQFERVIEQLEKTRIEMEHERDEAARLRKEYESKVRTEEARLKSKVEAAEKELEKTQAKAAQIMASAQSASDFVLAQLEEVKKKQQAASFAEDLSKARADIRRAMKEAGDRVNPVVENTDEDYVLPRPLKKGDTVELINVGTRGTVTADPDKNGNLTVRTGMINTRTNVSNLRLIEEAATVTTADRKKTAASSYQITVSRTFSPSLDLRGEIGDDAWFHVDHYLDEAKMAGVLSVTLIHGKGTGALRAALWERLKRDKRVKSYRMGAYGEGDAGVTVVELKK